MQYPPTELVLNSNGQVYHLGLSPEQISDKIILVGDQDRVDMVSSFFDVIEHRSQHREFKCHTGTYKGKRVTALSTGIGTDNIDIVVNELDALINIDLQKREDRLQKQSLALIRIGTCGILQSDIPVHSYILSSFAAGLDNIAYFYNIDYAANEIELAKGIRAKLNLPEQILPYVIEANSRLNKLLVGPQVHKGITITSSGFYGPQGRQLRLTTQTQALNDSIQQFSQNENRIVNFEMESSALFALSKGLGHEATTICLGIANRPNKEFSKGYSEEMKGLIEYVLERI